MKICIIAINLPNPISDRVGGACEKLLYYIIKELSRTNEIHVIVDRKTLGAQLDDLVSSVHFHGFDNEPRFTSKLLEYVRFVLYLSKLDFKYDFDIFHSFSFPFAPITLLLSKLRRKPVVFSDLTHVTWVNERKGLSMKADFWINIVPAIWFATTVIVPSRFIKERMVQSVKCPPKKVIVIPYGVPQPANLANRKSFREKHEISESTPILTFVGRLVPYKGVHSIIEAVYILGKSFPDIRLIVAGPEKGDFTSSVSSDNPYYAGLLSLRENLGLSSSVLFTGFLGIEELHELFADTTIFVFPSTEEAFGLVLIEAMAMGLPIITTNVPPMTEIIDDHSGKFVDPDSPRQIADRVNALLSNPQLLKEISEYNVTRFYAEYELGHMINKLVELYGSFY
jgi:glycosyltransferase involved in cell wall biosynthesis